MNHFWKKLKTCFKNDTEDLKNHPNDIQPSRSSQICSEKYQKIRVLQQNIWLCVDNHTQNEQYLIGKIIYSHSAYQKELQILSICNNSNIQNVIHLYKKNVEEILLDSITMPKFIWLEYCNGGDLLT